MKKIFKRTIQSLDSIFEFIGEFAKANAVDEAALYTTNLAIEELFTNMVKYNPENSTDISLIIQRNDDELMVTLIDPDTEPFDLTRTAEVDVTKSLAEREGGGLGIHLVKKMVDHLEYDYTNRQSRVTFIKRLES